MLVPLSCLEVDSRANSGARQPRSRRAVTGAGASHRKWRVRRRLRPAGRERTSERNSSDAGDYVASLEAGEQMLTYAIIL